MGGVENLVRGESGEEKLPSHGALGWGEAALPQEAGARCLWTGIRPSLAFLTWPSVTEETIHLPPAPDIVGEG